MDDDNSHRKTDDSKTTLPEDESQEKQPPSTSQTVSDGPDAANGGEKKKSLNIPSLIEHNGFLFPGIPASPPQFVSLEQIMEAASGVSNMSLAHEIAVNKEFMLEKIEPESSIEKQVKQVVHKAFWDAFEAKLQQTPPDFSHAMVLLSDIKTALSEVLLPQHTRLKNQIDEVLDLDLIRQQVENDSLDFQYYAKFIVSTMSRLCSPIRDEKIRELTAISDIVPLYKGILETLDLMKLDMANFAIQQIRPHIQQHLVEYERGKFQEFLEALAALTPPVDGLELTKRWFENVIKDEKLLDPSSASSSQKVSDGDIIVKAYLKILLWDNDSIFPETLQMDQVRFLILRDQLKTVIITASLLLVTYSIVGESIQGVTSLKQRLKDQLFVLLKECMTKNTQDSKELFRSIALQIIKEVNECLKEIGYPEFDASKTSLSAQLEEISSENHSVRKLICTRVLEFIEQLLKTTNTASVKFPPGLSAFNVELSGLAGQFLRLVNHNRSVFGTYYIDIISQIRKQHEEIQQFTRSD